MSSIVIGKIPGYNKEILNNTDEEYYKKRLIQGTSSRISMIPTGYRINTDNIMNPDPNASIFELGPHTVGHLVNAKNEILADTTAIEHWEKILENHKDIADFSGIEELIILGTNESTINESLNNEFGAGGIEDLLTSMQSKLGKVVSQGKKVLSGIAGYSSVTASSALDLLKGKGSAPAIFGTILAGKALGISMGLPQIWKGGSYNSNMQFMIKLIAPTGHPEDIKNYITKPLILLILAGSPMTKDSILYGYPPLWHVMAEGLMYMRVAGIESIILTRGGNDTSFNKVHQPLHIDVRIVIKPIIPGFASSASSDAASKAMAGQSMMTTPHDLAMSMSEFDYGSSMNLPNLSGNVNSIKL